MLTVRKIPHFRCGRCRTVLFVLSCLGQCLMLRLWVKFHTFVVAVAEPCVVVFCIFVFVGFGSMHDFGIPHFRCGRCRTVYCCTWALYCRVWADALRARDFQNFRTFVAAVAEPCLLCCAISLLDHYWIMRALFLGLQCVSALAPSLRV